MGNQFTDLLLAVGARGKNMLLSFRTKEIFICNENKTFIISSEYIFIKVINHICLFIFIGAEQSLIIRANAENLLS